MNFRTTAILAVLLAVVATVVFIVARQPEKPLGESEQSVVDLDSAAVTKITVNPADGRKLVLEKSGTDWKLLSPVSGLADSFNVDSLVRAFTDLKARGVGDASDLKKAAWTVEIDAGDKHTKLSIGPRPEVGDNLYVQVDGKPRPLLVSASLCDELEKPAKSYRQMRMVSDTAPSIRQITITRPEGKLVIQRNSHDDWELLEPKKMPLDPNAVSDLTFAIANLTAAEYVDAADVPALANPTRSPRMTVWFSTAAPTTQPSTTRPAGTTIDFGSFATMLKKNVYVYIDSTQSYATVAASSLDAFRKKPIELRNKQVFDVVPSEVSRVSVVSEKPVAGKPAVRHELVIERRKENLVLGPEAPTTRPATQPTTRPVTPPPPVSKWVLVSEKGAEASESKVDTLLGKFNPLTADKYLEAAPATTQPAATYTVEVTGATGGKTTTHRVSIVDPGDDKPLVASYQDLRFELPRTFADDLTGDFANKPETPAPAPK